MGKKIGMTTRMSEKGEPMGVTVIQIEPNTVVQIKTKANDGYEALQLATGDCKVKNLNKPQRVKLEKVGALQSQEKRGPGKLFEARVSDIAEFAQGQAIDVSQFQDCKYVDVTAFSKGKGFQGLVKMKHFGGGNASHGHSLSLRKAGARGHGRTTPGRCFKNMPQPSHMGNDQVTVQSVRVVMVDAARGLLLINGSVPGPINQYVFIQKAIKLN